MAQDDLKKNIERLRAISDWFANQEEIDVEEGLKRVKEAAVLIKASNKRLREVENEFKEIKRDIEAEISGEEAGSDLPESDS